jgi:drug/metabolite transporter (DMT)-like permease
MTDSNSNIIGIVLMCVAMGLASANDALIKLISDTLTTPQILLLRGLFVFVLSTAWIVIANHISSLKQLHNPWVLLRSSLEALAAVAYFSALPYMSIAELTAVFLITPLLIIAGAAIVYGEKVSYAGGAAIVAGFVGVLLIVKPGTVHFSLYAFLVLGSALLTAARDLLTRKIKDNVSSAIVCFSGGVSIALMGLILTAINWRSNPIPLHALSSPTLWLGLLIAAVVITIANYGVILAFRYSSASVISPFRYTSLLWATASGFLIWNDFPDSYALIGSAMLIAAGLYFVQNEWVLHRRRKLGLALLET